jgi:hypothetical protein
MPARLRVVLIVATLLIAGACSSSPSAVASITKHVTSLEPAQVTVAAINIVSSTVGPVVVGLVRNVSSTAVGGVQITAALTAKSGAPMGQPSFATTLLHVVPAGAEASFSIPFAEVPGTATSVSATVEADPFIPIPYVPITAVASAGKALGTDYEVSGTVTNSSSQAVTYPNVVATFYDHAGNVVGASHAVGTSDTVTPGGSAPFDIYLTQSGPLVSRYTLAAEGQLVAPSK